MIRNADYDGVIESHCVTRTRAGIVGDSMVNIVPSVEYTTDTGMGSTRFTKHE